MKKKLFLSIFIFILFLISSHLVFAASNPPDIGSGAAILIDAKTGKLIYEKNSEQKMYPASTTKIMTAILVLENCDNLLDKTVASYNAVMNVPYGYATVPLEIGEEFTIEQLLNLMLVPSANIAGNILAEYISGSIESFATMMNTKAVELGCKNTHFVNPYGLQDENHYSCAYDLALITQYAMKNEIFRSIVCKTTYQLPATNKYEKDDRVYTTTNELLKVNNNNRSDNYYYKYAIGIKTGFTSYAKNCLVSEATRDGLDFIEVILAGGQTTEGLDQRYSDAKALFNYGFENYAMRKVKEPNDIVKTDVIIKNATRDTRNLTVVIQNEIKALIKKEDMDKTLLPEITLNENLKAPIKKGDVVGTIKYVIEDIPYTSNVLAGNDVKKSSFFFILLPVLLVLFILYVFSQSVKRRKKRNGKKYKNYRKTH